MEADHLGEAIDDVRDSLECVDEGAPRRHVGLTEPRQIGSDEAKPVRKLRDEIAKHVTSGGKAVQQQDRRRVLRPGFAVKHAHAVDIHLPIRDCAHGNSFRAGDFLAKLQHVRPCDNPVPAAPSGCHPGPRNRRSWRTAPRGDRIPAGIYKSMTTSPIGFEQQTRRLPSAGLSSGCGS